MEAAESEGAAPPPPPPPPEQEEVAPPPPPAPPLAAPPPPLAALPAPLQPYAQFPTADAAAHQHANAHYAQYNDGQYYAQAQYAQAWPQEAPDAKRARLAPSEHSYEPEPVALPSTEERTKMCAALKKIRSHIRQVTKVEKASMLLCKLLSDGALSLHYRDETFQEEVPAPKALQKLLDALEKEESKFEFTAAQRRQIAVWRLAVIMPLQLATDDSFMFNKSAKNVRELVEALPAVEDEENSALEHILDKQWDTVRREQMALMDACSLDHMQKMEVNGSGTGQGIDGNSIGAAAASDDPFDLADMLKEEQKPEEKEQKPRPKAIVMVWNRNEAQAMRRHVLLGCLEKLKDRSSLPWARTAAHLALQSAKPHKESFCGVHQERLHALVSFLQKAKASVSKGPSTAQLKQDSNAFETARKEWGGKAVSSRGKVGGLGMDIQNASWLG